MKDDGIVLNVVAAGELIDLRHLVQATVLRPTEFHIKPDGSVEDMPSLVIVMQHPGFPAYATVGEISYAMLKPVISALEQVEREQKARRH